MSLPRSFQPHIDTINTELANCVPPGLPESLREPIRYFLQLPGKRIRPLLSLNAAQVVGGKPLDALDAAIAVELFHDFTLVHDDIMDNDSLRRGFETVHVKYGNSAAILIGDAMIGLALERLTAYKGQSRDQVTEIFSEALVKVCEGQALDKEFETRQRITIEEYTDMIAKKTAWLIQAACGMGAICGGAKQAEVRKLTEFGYYLGLGFQVLDDLLDFVADESVLGKTVGSDFLMDKKTYVTIAYRQQWYESEAYQSQFPESPTAFENLGEFQQALETMNITRQVQEMADEYHQKALAALESVMPLGKSNPLYQITSFLAHRNF